MFIFCFVILLCYFCYFFENVFVFLWVGCFYLGNLLEIFIGYIIDVSFRDNVNYNFILIVCCLVIVCKVGMII